MFPNVTQDKWENALRNGAAHEYGNTIYVTPSDKHRKAAMKHWLKWRKQYAPTFTGEPEIGSYVTWYVVIPKDKMG